MFLGKFFYRCTKISAESSYSIDILVWLVVFLKLLLINNESDGFWAIDDGCAFVDASICLVDVGKLTPSFKLQNE